MTPLMGWSSRKHLMSRGSFGDEIENDYSTSEKVIENTAEILHKEGYSKVGYNYIIIDESWSAPVRNKDGDIEPDHRRFPKGIHNLAKNLHKLGLKLGISGDIGSETCSGHPGSWANFDRDAKTFAGWEIDFLKVNGCFANESMLNEGYKNFGKALMNTKRPIIYSIDWPLHDRNVNFTEVVKISNLWRVYHNVHDTFESIMSVVDYVGANPNIFRKYSGPGSWADLDVGALRPPRNPTDRQHPKLDNHAAPKPPSALLQGVPRLPTVSKLVTVSGLTYPQ
ncbi:alpha-galactosidase A-like [Nilaparvata lugens]|uniref:alpha-galactosidase A-like n=1 Tax=Nilaparvata lugens TaxID=108931 RepID=UPI00193D8B7F|nr:alpha-galactosidase A-like [Nilaparvata lugens]